MSDNWMTVIFGAGSLLLCTIVVVVILIVAGRYLKTRSDRVPEEKLSELTERYQALAEAVSERQETHSADLADIRTRVVEIERLLREVG